MNGDDRLAEILWDWRERRDRGEYVDPEEVIAAHPEVANELRARFAALAAVDEVFAASLLAPPVPRRIGSFAVEREIGSGGMGTVYLAEVAERVPGLQVGQRVAIKVLHGHLLARPGFFRRFLREADLGRAVGHDNVVRVFGADAALVRGAQLNFLVMEYVDGRTLAQLALDLDTVPEALLREVAIQAAEGLAAIHAAGIVHRDIKPENLLITDDHRVRIMDLGIARDLDASAALTREGEFAGSFPYAAPEQFGETDVGPRADLYALGVVLYELATGSNPFRSDDMRSVMRAQLELIPAKATDRNADVSEFLSELLATLLEKSPDDRIESATALASLLAAGERSSWWAERERRLRETVARLPRVPVRRETRLFGRERDLDTLRNCWERARSGDGNVILLEGEAGIGKSRLVDALLRELEGEEVLVLYGSYPPAGGMGGLSDAIVGHFGATGLEATLAPYLPQTPSLVPALAALVTHELPPDGTPTLGGDALHAVFCHLMRNLAAEKPLLWIVDDLHFASADSRAIVLSMARAVATRRVLLLTTTRPGLPETELANLARVPVFGRMALGRLSPREVMELLRDAFRSEALAERLGGRIAFKSDGVPFFVFEMIRGLAEGQFITRLPDGTWVETKVVERIVVPSAVRDLIDVRMHDLSPGERAVLDVGAVHGYEFDPDLVARVLERKRVAILQDLAEVERRSGIVRGGRGVCRFDHHQIQEVLYEDLTPDLRTEYHALLAEAAEARAGARMDGELASMVCRHFLAGDRADRALRYLEPSLDHLAAEYRREEATTLARAALDAPDALQGERRIEILLRAAEQTRVLGRLDDAEASLGEAVLVADRLRSAPLGARTRIEHARVRRDMAQMDEAQRLLEEAAALSDEARDPGVEALLAGARARVLADLGGYDDAEHHAGRLLEMSRAQGDRAGEGEALLLLGVLANRRSRREDAGRFYEAARRVGVETGALRIEASAELGLSAVNHNASRYAQAREHAQRAIELSTRTGNRRGVATAIGNLGAEAFLRGALDEARSLYERHMALCREIGDRTGEFHSGLNIASVLAAVGRIGEALKQREWAVAEARELGDPRNETFALFKLAGTLSDLGRIEEAAGVLAESLERADASGLGLVSSHGRTLQARVLAQAGDLEGAERTLRKAIDLLRALRHESGLAEALDDLGRLLAPTGRIEEARACIDEARRCAVASQVPEWELLSGVRLALLDDGGLQVALDLLDGFEPDLESSTLMEIRNLLWRASGDPTHLAEAHALLETLREYAPPEYRDSMIENVPLHRDIMAAWREHGASESETVVPA